MRRRLFLLLFLVWFVPAAPAQYGEEKGIPPIDTGEGTIQADDIRHHLEFLASDEMKGRESGSEEAKKAAEYIAGHMKEWGLEPAGDGEDDYENKFSALTRICRNVCGVVPGADPARRREYVAVGAHFDHVGLGMFGSRTPARRGEVHNGADDNASGTSSLLELMEAFSKKPARRSLLFLAFSAEERGLLGSKAWVKAPTRPLQRITAMVNLDMVGRSKDRYLFVGGINTGTGFESLIRKENEPFSFDLELHGGGRAPSDNASFYEKDIPVLFFFTAEHPQYHTPDDDIELINVEGQTLITRLAYRVIRHLADAPSAPRFQEDDRNAMPAASSRGEDYVRQVLGVELGPYDPEAKGMPVTSLEANGLAAKARMREGDILLDIDGYTITSRQAVQSILAVKTKGERMRVRIQRGSRTLRATLVMP